MRGYKLSLPDSPRLAQPKHQFWILCWLPPHYELHNMWQVECNDKRESWKSAIFCVSCVKSMPWVCVFVNMCCAGLTSNQPAFCLWIVFFCTTICQGAYFLCCTALKGVQLCRLTSINMYLYMHCIEKEFDQGLHWGKSARRVFVAGDNVARPIGQEVAIYCRVM